MATRRFLIPLALAVLCTIPAAPVSAAHGGGGGGGGGMHGGGGGGGMHGGWGGGGSMHSSPGGGGAAYAQNYSGSHFTQYSGSWSQGNSVRSSNPNWSGSLHSQMYHPNGYANWGHNDWDHYFQNRYWGPGWGASWYWGYPFGFSYWGGYPFGWDGDWADYFCPYGSAYATGYPPTAFSYPYADNGQYTANFAYAPSPVMAADDLDSEPGDGNAVLNEGLQFYNEARAAFARGDYRNALRLASHSGVESPQNGKVHELTSLALFASGEYRAAATEAHAALALGPPSDWGNLYAYYNDAAKYTEQLRKLEKTVVDVPTSAPGHFLLGYHYLMTGAKAEAKEHFAQAAKLTPNDKLAQHILKQLESSGAVMPPELPKQPVAPKGKLL